MLEAWEIQQCPLANLEGHEEVRSHLEGHGKPLRVSGEEWDGKLSALQRECQL